MRASPCGLRRVRLSCAVPISAIVARNTIVRVAGRVYISSQNHGYVVDTDKLDPAVAKPAFVNVNDGTNEGLEYVGKQIFTVQFHPEACPGPQDSAYLFDRFIEMMGGN